MNADATPIVADKGMRVSVDCVTYGETMKGSSAGIGVVSAFIGAFKAFCLRQEEQWLS